MLLLLVVELLLGRRHELALRRLNIDLIINVLGRLHILGSKMHSLLLLLHLLEMELLLLLLNKQPLLLLLILKELHVLELLRGQCLVLIILHVVI